MGYTMLKNSMGNRQYDRSSLEGAALDFIRECCRDLRFSEEMADAERMRGYLGTSLHENEIPYNMQMDVDRLCLENAVGRFLGSGTREDAFDVYFCYLEMFVGDYEKTRRMIELLSEFEANGSGLLMKHRDHYSHSVYVFALGLAIYRNNSIYREEYRHYYGLTDERLAACHYLQYWGLTSLFHDIGYPFELPFEQVASYFEVSGNKREARPYVAYHSLQSLVDLNETVQSRLAELFDGRIFKTSNELFAYSLSQKLSDVYSFTEEQMLAKLRDTPTKPDQFNYFMDHGYFSAAVLFQRLFCDMGCPLAAEHVDALTAILMHNSLYKFSIAHYKDKGNIPFRPELHPLAYMLMLCDELQCWDRTAYGRNSKRELYPMDCRFCLNGDTIRATYLFDAKEISKINAYKDSYIEWLTGKSTEKPKLKAYSGMFEMNADGISDFQENIERIVDLSRIKLHVETGLCENVHAKGCGYLSGSSFLNLYHFAMILNGRWDSEDWQSAKAAGQEDRFLSDPENMKKFSDSFKRLSLEYKLSNISQAKAFARYMDAIDCFYTDKDVDFEMVERFSAEDLVTIGRMEHQRWLQEHYDMGWEYGTPERSERELARQHKDMIPGFDLSQRTVSLEQAERNYDRLDQAERDKDSAPMECMLAMLRMFDGLRIYRLKS